VSGLYGGGTECSDMKVGCFRSIGMEQLHGVIENRNLGSPLLFLVYVNYEYIGLTSNRVLDYSLTTV
jgi:hypothetical protein